MLLSIFSNFIQTHNVRYHVCIEYCLYWYRYITYYFLPWFGKKIHRNLRFLSVSYHFWIFKQIRFIATVHHNHFYQIWPVFVTCFLPWKLICNPPHPLVFVPYTLTYASLYTIVNTPFPLLVGYDCAHFLYCKTTDMSVLYLWSNKYLTYMISWTTSIALFSCF